MAIQDDIQKTNSVNYGIRNLTFSQYHVDFDNQGSNKEASAIPLVTFSFGDFVTVHLIDTFN